MSEENRQQDKEEILQIVFQIIGLFILLVIVILLDW